MNLMDLLLKQNKVIGQFFFQLACLQKLGYQHAFQPFTYSLGPFSRCVGVGAAIH